MDVVTEQADLAAAAADEAIRKIEEAEAEAEAAEAAAAAAAAEAATDRPEVEARACSGCGLALLEQRELVPGLVCSGGCEREFAAGQSRWSCANRACQIEICSPCLEVTLALTPSLPLPLPLPLTLSLSLALTLLALSPSLSLT